MEKQRSWLSPTHLHQEFGLEALDQSSLNRRMTKMMKVWGKIYPAITFKARKLGDTGSVTQPLLQWVEDKVAIPKPGQQGRDWRAPQWGLVPAGR